MKKIIIVIFALVINFVNAEWVALDKEIEPGKKFTFSWSSNSFKYEFYGFNKTNVNLDSSIYDRISLPGTESVLAFKGFPELPCESTMIEVLGENPTAIVENINYVTYENYNIAPLQEVKADIDESEIEITKNSTAYNTNKFFPESVVSISNISIIRGHKVARLTLAPFQYNPVTRQLRVVKDVNISVPQAGSAVNPHDNKHFTSLFKNNIPNYIENPNADEIADLYIVTTPEYENVISDFVSWKKKNGFRVTVLSGSEYSDPDEIYWNLYRYWDEEDFDPEYVVFMGETDKVATNYSDSLHVAEEYYQGRTGTDLYYSLMDKELLGNDDIPGLVGAYLKDLPDFFTGRITADNAEELAVILNKIVKYEKFPVWSNKMLFATYAQDNNIDRACDRYFLQTTEELYKSLEDSYENSRIYTTNNYLIPPLWYKDYDPEGNNTEEVRIDQVWDYYTSEWIAGDAVRDKINENVFLVNHRNHGASRNTPVCNHDGWGHPRFTTDHVPSLTNNQLSVMFSINCMTGWFDGTTDDFNSRDYDCLGEELLGKENGGVVGYIGASRVSFSGFNDVLDKGLFNALFAEKLPNTDISQFRLGQVLENGKYEMLDKYICTNGEGYSFDDGSAWEFAKYSEIEYEIFHVLGDPSMPVWIDRPENAYAAINYAGNVVRIVNKNGNPIPQAKVMVHGASPKIYLTDASGYAYISTGINQNNDISYFCDKYVTNYNHVFANGASTNIDSNFDIRGDLIVRNNSTLNLSGTIKLPPYAKIIVEDGSTLKFDYNTHVLGSVETIVGDPQGDYSTTVFGNRIEVYGKLFFGKNVKLTSENNQKWDGLFLYNSAELQSRTIDEVTFENCKLTNNSENIEIKNCEFNNSGIISSSTESFDLKNSLIKNSENHGVFLGSTTNFTFKNCIIEDNNGVGIYLYRSGVNTVSCFIDDTVIRGNMEEGLKSYNSDVLLLGTFIYNNKCGIAAMRNSSISLQANGLFHNKIYNNTLEEIWFVGDSSILMDNGRNQIYDESFEYGSKDQYLLYCLNLNDYIQMRRNNWSKDMDDSYNHLRYYPTTHNDLSLTKGYNLFPIWTGNEEYVELDSTMLAATFFLKTEKLISLNAEDNRIVTSFKKIIGVYPETMYAFPSAQRILNIAGDQSEIKEYLSNIPQDVNNCLTKNQKFLVNECNMKSGDYLSAINWFTSVIDTSTSESERLFCKIDSAYAKMKLIELEDRGGKNSIMDRNFSDYEHHILEVDQLISGLMGEYEKSSQTLPGFIPQTTKLHKAYPNPFNPTTTIKFDLAKKQNVKIAVYDVRGREITVLANSKMNAGAYTRKFNASNLASGIYFVRMITNFNNIHTQKLTLIK